MLVFIPVVYCKDLPVIVAVTVPVTFGRVVVDVWVVVLEVIVVVGAGVIVLTGVTVTLDVNVIGIEIVLVDEGTGLVDFEDTFVRHICCE